MFNGTEVTRDTNDINDLIADVTFSLKGDSPVDTTITAEIEPDADVIYNGVVDVLNAYNDIKFFVSDQTEKDAAGNFTEDAVLGGENLLKEVLRDVESEFTAIVNGISGNSGIFSIGVDFKDYPGDDDLLPTRDIFTLDEDKLRTALESDFEGVRQVFAYELVADSPELSVFSRTNDSTLTSFKLDIDETRDEGEKIRVLDQDDNFLFYAEYEQNKDVYGNVIGGSGGTIIGPEGSALDGTQLVYSGDGTDVISVNATQGVADRTFTLLKNVLDENTGALAGKISEFQDQNEDLQEKIDKETVRIELERELLIRRFAVLEQAVAQANGVLQLFEAQANANSE